jgi:hypothetical protein
MISGLKSYYDPRHYDRLVYENNMTGSKSEIIHIETRKLSTVLEQTNTKHINYLSIDVEGAEFSVIKSIDFDKVFIDVIGFENNYNDNSVPIIEYLQNKGFIRINTQSMDIFMIHKDSKFISNIA